MTITTTRKIIKIGSSSGVTIPSSDLKHAGLKEGDEVEVVFRKKNSTKKSSDITETAKDILDRYSEDFKNLADR